MSANNCETCDYSKYEHGEGHCYMFRKEPEGVCMRHTGRRGVFLGHHAITLATVMGMLADMHAEEEANRRKA